MSEEVMKHFNETKDEFFKKILEEEDRQLEEIRKKQQENSDKQGD